MSDDEDDPVVEEIPVYLSHTLAEQLYIFQYPVIPVALSSSSHNVLKSRIKPENKEVELDLGLDINSPNYDKSHGEQIASSVDNDKAREARMYSSKAMDKIRLESSRVLAESETIGVGVMLGKELHISPIQGVFSLSPSFKHLDQKKLDNDEESEGEAARAESSLADETRRKRSVGSYSALSRRIAQEPWFHTQYFDVDSPKAQMERGRVRCETREVHSLSSSKRTPVKSAGVPGTPLEEKLRKVLTDTGLACLSSLSSLTSASPSELLPHLTRDACLIQGNWTLRSHLKYTAPSSVNGVPMDTMADARDYMLYHLCQGESIERKALGGVVRLPGEELEEMLKEVTHLGVDRRWHLKLPPDHDFLARYTHVVEQQKLLWDAKYKQLIETFSSCSSPKTPRRRRESSESKRAGPS